MITTILKTNDTIVIIVTTSSSITLSVTGIGKIAIPLSAATASQLSIGKKLIFEIVKQKYNKYKINLRKMNKQLNGSVNYIQKLYQITFLRKVKMNVYVLFLIYMLMKRKMILFYKQEYEN